MSKLEVLTSSGGRISLPEADVEALRARVRGELLTAASPDYDEARSIWNAMIDKRPALIVRCRDTADVMASVAFAAQHQLLLAVRGGGHNIAGNAACDGGMMIHLGDMHSVRVDPDAKRAWVGPGATLGDVDHATQAFGLAVPTGINSTTGIAGLTLGGGFGWISRKHGLTVDNLVSAEVVTAKGARVRASAGENPDLFWAIRGGGGNFGVVTEFEFQLHPVGPEVLCGLMVFPFAEAKTLLARYREFVAAAPEELTVWLLMRQAPPLPFLPAEKHGTEIVAFLLCHCGDPAAGQKQIAPLREMGTLLGEHVGVQPFAAWQQGFDPLLTPGARNYWKSHNLADVSDGATETILQYIDTLPGPECEMFIAHVRGKASRVDADATAYAHRDVEFIMNVHGRWQDAADDAACIGWAREFFAAMTPHASGGVYVNFMPADETDRIPAAYGAKNWQRLVEAKRKWDPENLFRVNQNIAP